MSIIFLNHDSVHAKKQSQHQTGQQSKEISTAKLPHSSWPHGIYGLAFETGQLSTKWQRPRHPRHGRILGNSSASTQNATQNIMEHEQRDEHCCVKDAPRTCSSTTPCQHTIYIYIHICLYIHIYETSTSPLQ